MKYITIKINRYEPEGSKVWHDYYVGKRFRVYDKKRSESGFFIVIPEDVKKVHRDFPNYIEFNPLYISQDMCMVVPDEIYRGPRSIRSL